MLCQLDDDGASARGRPPVTKAASKKAPSEPVYLLNGNQMTFLFSTSPSLLQHPSLFFLR